MSWSSTGLPSSSNHAWLGVRHGITCRLLLGSQQMSGGSSLEIATNVAHTLQEGPSRITGVRRSTAVRTWQSGSTDQKKLGKSLVQYCGHTQGGVSRESSQSAASPSLALKSGARGLRLLLRLSQYAFVSAKKSIHFCDAGSTACEQTRKFNLTIKGTACKQLFNNVCAYRHCEDTLLLCSGNHTANS